MQITTDLTKEETDVLRQKLDEFNEPFVGSQNVRHVRLAMRNSTGELIGGLFGAITWEWFHINVIWVTTSLRDSGYGSKLLEAAELDAINKGAEYVQLHTFSFQAKEFYEKHGYKVLAKKNNFPKGHSQYLMFKVLPPCLT